MVNAQIPGASEPGAYAVPALNSLIEMALDSADNSEKAAALARNPRFQSLFRQRAQHRRDLAEALKPQVRALGGEPWEKGSFRGKAQRAFLALRDRLSGQSDKALVEEVGRGEDFILGQFARTATDEALPPEVRAGLKPLLGRLQDEHDEISAIKREFD